MTNAVHKGEEKYTWELVEIEVKSIAKQIWYRISMKWYEK